MQLILKILVNLKILAILMNLMTLKIKNKTVKNGWIKY